MGCLRTLKEEHRFTQQCAAIGDAHRVDEALSAVTWALSRKPEAYPVLPGFNTLRLIVTDSFSGSGLTIPRLRVYFKILNEDEVQLLWVETDLEEGLDEEF